MGFRDDNEALRQRVQHLEDELAEAKAEIEELRSPPKVRVDIEADSLPTTSGLAAKVAAKERAERDAKTKEERARHQRRARYLKRLREHGERVRVAQSGSEVVIDVGPSSMRDQLIEQMGFGFFFFAVNPGIFVVGGLAFLLSTFTSLTFGAAIGIALPIWLSVLVLLNLVWAHYMRPRFRIALDADNVEARQTGNEGKSFLGRRSDLRVDIEDHGENGIVELRLAGRSIEIRDLLAADVEAIRRHLPESKDEDWF